MKQETKSLVVHGGIKLPIGYRFRPTDEELLVHYLRRKELGLPLPAGVIPEYDVFQAEPWSLPGCLTEKRYFFGKIKGSKDDSTVAGSGLWKVSRRIRLVMSSTSNRFVGMRRTHVFCQGRPCSHQARWYMHEFHLFGSKELMESEHWAIYRVFQKKQQRRVTRDENEPSRILFISDSLGSEDPLPPSSPCSSGITEVSCGGLDLEEISSL